MSTALIVRPQIIPLARLLTAARIAAYNAPLAERGITSLSTSDCYFGPPRNGGTSPRQPQITKVDIGPTLEKMRKDTRIRKETLELLQMLHEFNNS